MGQEHLSWNVTGTTGLAAQQEHQGIDMAQQHLLQEIAGLNGMPDGAFNIRPTVLQRSGRVLPM